MQVIYKITNLINNKIYIGSAVDFSVRKSVHKSRLKSNGHHSPKLQAAWNKYGEENFKFEIIEEISNKEDLIPKEQYWMDSLKPYYNCNPNAKNSLGKKASDQSKKRMSLAHMGKKLSKESLEKRTLTRKMNGWNKLPKPKESNKRISEVLKQKYKNKEIIHPLLGTTLSNERKQFMREVNEIPILQYSVSGVFIKEYSSLKKAQLETGMSSTTIINILKGRTKNPKRFIFKYKSK